MGGKQETHIGDGSSIEFDRDKDGLQNSLNILNTVLLFPLDRAFEFCLLCCASSPRVRDVEGTHPCVPLTQGLTRHLVRVCPVTLGSTL